MAIFGRARLPKSPGLEQSRTAETQSIDDQGLSTRRAVAHGRPRLGGLNDLLAKPNEDHRMLRCIDWANREPRPTKYGSDKHPPLLAPGF